MFCRKVAHPEQGRASAIPEKPGASEELENGTRKLMSHSSKKGHRGLGAGRWADRRMSGPILGRATPGGFLQLAEHCGSTHIPPS